MTAFLNVFILIPVIGYLLSLIVPKAKENTLSWVAFFTVGIHAVGCFIFTLYWLFNGFPNLNIKDVSLFQTTGYDFFLDFYFDKITAVYLFVGSFLTFLVTVYSRYYMHREGGYKRFFNSILFFYIGYTMTVLSGNLETLFMGWEILGVSSFLLIAFYRDRYLPVKNAVKVFSVYRIGDIGIILAMWMTHHLWHENITFLKLNNVELVHEHLQSHSTIGVVISMMILISAAAKSAQLPFSSWLPRAMEGPTPSSAIFYGALSVHIGVFLLLRTFPFWEHQYSVRIIIAVLGFFTTFVTSGIARVQSSVKSQIAYASASQIGLIFIEVACGFDNLALLHFAGNAFLRSYQLLVSPSVVTYLIREQFYNFSPNHHSIESLLPQRIRNAVYILCLKEWNLDSLMYRLLWNPLKLAGRKLDFLNMKRIFLFFISTYTIGWICWYNFSIIPDKILDYLPIVFAFIGLIMVLKSFTERKKSRMSWVLVIMNHLWIALAVSFNERFTYLHIVLYLSGILVAGVVGYVCLRRLKKLEFTIGLNQFHGHAYKHPKIALVFLLCCLSVTGFPITPTFIGEDLVFTHIRESQTLLAFFVSLSFVVDGLSIIRIYARVFMGPHAKSTYEMAYRSS